MGKKAKANKRRRKYSKQEFMMLCCDKCILCDPGVDPSFCYGKIYIKDPKVFIKSVFKDLLGFGQVLGTAGYSVGNSDPDAMLKILFQETFCDSKICREFSGSIECPDLELCLFEFSNQLTGKGKIVGTNNKSYRRKKNTRQVYEPYPTFFCNAKFEQTVKELLNDKTNEGADNGDVDIEQDKIEERTCEHDRGINQSANSEESEVSGSTGSGQKYIQNTSIYL